VRDSDAIWRDLHALTAGRFVDHLLLLGDQVYADQTPLRSAPRETATSRALSLGPDSPLADRVGPFREACEDAGRSPALQSVQSRLPTALLWDDHEIINSYGAKAEHLGPQGRALFEAAAAAFDEMQGSRNPPALAGGSGGSRAWAFRRGPAAFLGLDLRTHRNFVTGTLLGGRQKRAAQDWLEGEARAARVLFVATSVPVLHLPRIIHALRGIGDIRDQWEIACKADRAWLLDRLRDFEEGGRRRAVLLGGDAHVASAAHLSDRSGHAIWQVVSSPLAQRLPLLVYPALRLLGRRFGVSTGDGERLAAFIVRRWRGPNVGVVRGNVDEDDGRIDLSFELYRPGRRTRRVDLHSKLEK
jgi:alkaline phosphatase D